MQKHELPPPPGPALNWRYVTARDDWYVKTAQGWFWLDQRKLVWMPMAGEPL